MRSRVKRRTLNPLLLQHIVEELTERTCLVHDEAKAGAKRYVLICIEATVMHLDAYFTA